MEDLLNSFSELLWHNRKVVGEVQILAVPGAVGVVERKADLELVVDQLRGQSSQEDQVPPLDLVGVVIVLPLVAERGHVLLDDGLFQLARIGACFRGSAARLRTLCRASS